MAPPTGEARRARRRVARRDVGATDRARPAIEVFVTAPDRKVSVTRRQIERQITDRVRVVEADERADCVRSLCHSRAIEGLPGPVLNARPQHQCQSLAFIRDSRADVALVKRVFSSTGADFDQFSIGVKAMPGDVRRDRMAIRRKGSGFDQYATPGAGGSIETGQHQVQVDGQGVHRNDVGRFCAGQRRETDAQLLGVINPRSPCAMVSVDSQGLPVAKFLFDIGRRAARRETQRVATQINEWRAVGGAWQTELLAEELPASRRVSICGGCGGQRVVRRR